MKKLALTCLVILFSFVAVVAQSNPVWKEMKDFHSLMSSTFHPAEDGNFLPLKTKAEQMLSSAVAWQKSAIPVNYKPAETKSALTELVKQTTAVRDAVLKKAPDEELKNLITGAHEIFHKIVGECKISDK
jgi:hypothetical protein